MARSEKVIITNLCMVYDGEGRILVQDRVDPSWPGLCFPGGHVEPGESFVESVIREVREETGLTIEDPVLCGTKQFYTKEGERYVVFFFKTGKFYGELRSSEEGEVFWITKEDLKHHILADDFLDMLRVFEEDTLSEFYYYTENGDWKHKLL
jgi:8-oxo-dGTP diphosphatase